MRAKIIVKIVLVLAVYFLVPAIYSEEDEFNFWANVYAEHIDGTKEINGTAYLKGIPIQIEGDVNFTEKDLMKMIETQPDVLLSNCKKIYVCDPDIETTCSQTYTGANGMSYEEIAGFVKDDGSGRVYLRANNENKYINGTLTHELMHLFDFNNGVSSSEYGMNLYNTYKYAITEYGATEPLEFFAEASELYFYDQDQMQTEERKPIYDYFKSWFPEYAQY